MHSCSYRQGEAAVQRGICAGGHWVGDQPASHMDLRAVAGLETGCAWWSPAVLSWRHRPLPSWKSVHSSLSFHGAGIAPSYRLRESWLCEMSHICCLKNLHQQMENVGNLPNLMSPVLLLVQESWLLPRREDWGYNTLVIKDHLFPSSELLNSHEALGCFHNYFQFLKFLVNTDSSAPPIWRAWTGLQCWHTTGKHLFPLPTSAAWCDFGPSHQLAAWAMPAYLWGAIPRITCMDNTTPLKGDSWAATALAVPALGLEGQCLGISLISADSVVLDD